MLRVVIEILLGIIGKYSAFAVYMMSCTVKLIKTTWHHRFNELQQLINTEDVKGRYNISSFNLDVGDCTAHHGWTLHAAQSQPKHSNVARVAIGFSYVYTHARVLGSMTKAHPVDRKVPDEDEISYGQWLPDMNQGDPINHPLLPIVFP